MAQQVTIIGAGVLGQALAKSLPQQHAQVSFWDIDEAKCPGGRQPLETLIPAADFVFLCVPSWVIRQAVAQFSSLIRPQTVVISFAKGLESTSAKTMDQVCAEVLPPNQPLAVMGGAMLAHEIQAGLPAMGVIGSRDDAVASALIALWQGSAVQLAWVSDPLSVAVGGVLKNVYAVALGIGDGLGLGSNARGWLFAQAVKEMVDIGKILKADQAVLLSVAGVGDLVATGLSTQSKNHTAGMQIAQTGRTAVECEGIIALPTLVGMVSQRQGLRLFSALDAIVLRNQNPRIIMQDLIYKKGS